MCEDGTRDLGQHLFKARPGLVQTTREQLLSGSNRVLLAQIVALRQHISFAQELDVVFEADVKWYEVPRDTSNRLDCSQVYLLKPQLLGGTFIVNVTGVLVVVSGNCWYSHRKSGEFCKPTQVTSSDTTSKVAQAVCC